MTYRASAPFTSQWRHFRFDVADGVATVTFDRPDRLNALTLDVYADLRDLFVEIEHHDDVAVVVIRGEGRGFAPAATWKTSSGASSTAATSATYSSSPA